MELTLGEVADAVGGTLHGDGAQPIRGVCGLAEAGRRADDHLSFATGQADVAALRASAVRAVLVRSVPDGIEKNFVCVRDPYLACAKIAQRFHPLPRAEETRIHDTAVVAADAELGTVTIGPHAVVESGASIGDGTVVQAGVVVGANCRIGRACVLHPRVVLYPDVVLGDRVRVHAGAILGADGFGNAREGAAWVRFPQTGGLVIEDDVEIGACTTIDRGTFDPTRVGRGCRIDNLVMIAHNCQLGENVALAGQVGLAGSTIVGNRVLMAGQAGVAGHLKIEDDVVVGAQGGVIGNLPKGGPYIGFPAMPAREFMKMIARMRRDAKRSDAGPSDPSE